METSYKLIRSLVIFWWCQTLLGFKRPLSICSKVYSLFRKLYLGKYGRYFACIYKGVQGPPTAQINPV